MPRPEPPLWRRILAWTILNALYAGVLGLVWAGFLFIRHALRPGIHVDDRVYYGMAGAGLLFLPVRVGWIFLDTKLSTGRWLKTKEAAAEQRAQCSAQRRAGSLPAPSWILFAANWASYAATNPGVPLWKRILGWGLLILVVACVLGLAAASVICLVAGVATILTGGYIMILIGLALLLFPALVVWPFIRRKRETGSWCASLMDVQEMSALMATRRDRIQARESQKPLRNKLISTAIALGVMMFWWVRVTLYHSRHPHESWVTPAMYTPFALYAIVIQFREPKQSNPEIAPSE